MKSEFPLIPLGEVMQVRSGFAFKSSDMGNSGHPIIKIKNIKPPTVDIENCDHIPEEVIQNIPNYDRYLLNSGDTLIAMTGATVGKVGKFFADHKNYFLNQRVGKVYILENNLSTAEYIYQVLSTKKFSRDILALSEGSAQGNISGSQIEKYKIPLPPIEIQNSIGNILSTFDKKIRLNKKTNQTLEEIAKTLFKSWFIDFDPVRAKAEGRPTGLSKEISDLFPDSFEESELGDIPRGWSSASIDEACEKIFSGGTPSTKVPEYWNGTHGWLSSGETRSSFILNTEKLITDAGVENSSTKAALRFDTVIASAGQGKTRGQTSLLLIDTYVNQSIVTLRAKKDVGALLLFFNLARRYDEFRTYSDSSSSRGSLTSTLLKELPFVIPTYEITSLFNKLILPLVEKIEVNLNENKVLSNLKDTLLPKLISGELKISDAENLIDEAGI